MFLTASFFISESEIKQSKSKSESDQILKSCDKIMIVKKIKNKKKLSLWRPSFLFKSFLWFHQEHRPSFLIKCQQQRLLGLQFAQINHPLCWLVFGKQLLVMILMSSPSFIFTYLFIHYAFLLFVCSFCCEIITRTCEEHKKVQLSCSLIALKPWNNLKKEK